LVRNAPWSSSTLNFENVVAYLKFANIALLIEREIEKNKNVYILNKTLVSFSGPSWWLLLNWP